MTTEINTIDTKEDEEDVDPVDLENLTDEQLLSTLQKLEEEKELLTQHQLLKEIGKLQNELKRHKRQKSEKQQENGDNDTGHQTERPSTDESDVFTARTIDELPIEELSEQLEELKRQRDELSNKTLLDEIDELQNDIQQLQLEADIKETRMIAKDAVAVYALSPTEIEIRWDSSEFGQVESYNVFYKTAVSEDDEYQTIPLDGDATSCVIPNLHGNTAYHVKMEADGVDKSEIRTDTVEVTTYKPERGFVLILANYKGFELKDLVDLEGTIKDVEDLRSVFESISFEVVVAENLTGAQMIESILEHRQKIGQFVINSFILVLTSYKYHGYIFGTDGGILINKLIDYLKFNPDEDPPDARDKQRLVLIDTVKIREEVIQELDATYQPRNVRIRYNGLTSIEISFRPPKLSDFPVTKFVVGISGSENSKIKTLDAIHSKNGYSSEFSKLRSDTEYSVHVLAAYGEKNGEAIGGIVKTQRKESNAPRCFGVELISQSQIYAFWKPATFIHHDSIFYRIYLEEPIGQTYQQTTLTYPCHIFDNLKPNTMYKIKVATIKIENNNIEESDTSEISLTTPKDGTPIIMADSTTSHILGEPNFLIASASGAFVSDDSPSFLNCFKRHLEKKVNRYDVSSIIQDVRNELVYTSERYETPVLSSTLNRNMYLGGMIRTDIDEN